MSFDDADTEPVVRRFEVFKGAGRRRSWTDEGKIEILADSYLAARASARLGTGSRSAVRSSSLSDASYGCRRRAAA